MILKVHRLDPNNIWANEMYVASMKDMLQVYYTLFKWMGAGEIGQNGQNVL